MKTQQSPSTKQADSVSNALAGVNAFSETEVTHAVVSPAPDVASVPASTSSVATPTPIALPQQTKARLMQLAMLDDQPLDCHTSAKDQLEFGVMAEVISDLINDPATGTPFTLAINAPWGAGKSSLGQMVRCRLEEKNAYGVFKPHVTCWFDAWKYDDAANMSATFIAEVTRAANARRSWIRRCFQPVPGYLMTAEDKRSRKLTLGACTLLLALVLFGACAEAMSHTPALRDGLTALVAKLSEASPKDSKTAATATAHVVGPLATAVLLLKACIGIGKLMEPIGKPIADFVNNPKETISKQSLECLRKQLEKLIKQATPIGSKFVIFIDDLDRCRPPRAIDLLEAVNQLLPHHNVVTVVMADMSVLASCAALKYKPLAIQQYGEGGNLSPTQSRAFGRAFLQKLVQLQFDIPPHTEASIERLVSKLIQESSERQSKTK